MDFEFENEEQNFVEEIVRTCKDCGDEFTVSASEQKFYSEHGLEFPQRCPNCRDARKQAKVITCVECGTQFTMMAGEIDFYERNGFQLPKRCPECRKARKQRNENRTEEVTGI